MPATNISGVDFKDQEEAREYAKRVGIEYKFGCLEEKQPGSCHLLGDYQEAIEQNRRAAFETFRDNCLKRNHPHSCFKYGRYLVYGKKEGVAEVWSTKPKVQKKVLLVCDRSFDQALEGFTRSCAGGFSEGCRMKGLVLLHGTESQPPKPEQAETEILKACDQENSEACWQLSSLFLPIEKNPKKAEDTKKEKLEKPESELPHHGPHIRVDMQKALMYGVKACELGNYQSCANVSRMYKIGQGMKKDENKAKEYKQKAKDIVESVEKNYTLNFQEGT